MKIKQSFSLFISTFLFVGFLFLALAERGNAGFMPLPPCPCDTEELSNGLSGNEIVEIVCPGGNLGDDSSISDRPEEVRIALEVPPSSDYETSPGGPGESSCVINSDGVEPVNLDITDEQFELCRQRLLIGCGFGPPPPTLIPSITSVPTLSGWGFLSLAVVLALVGLGAILAKRKKASA